MIARSHFRPLPRLCFRLILLLSALLPSAVWAGPAGADRTGAPRIDSREEAILLDRGAFILRWYRPARGTSKGLFILGSGDGGWSYWEERVARHLAEVGWTAAGIDFARYADTDFTEAVLAGDYARIVGTWQVRVGKAVAQAPVIYGGWSMGAEQALPAAAGLSSRPSQLRGLLLVAPGTRGRYGLHTADKLGLTPTGAGTFALADLAPALATLPLAQLHAGLDPLDDTGWSRDLPVRWRLWTYPRAFHDFDGASEAFLIQFDEALAWLLASPSPAPRLPPAPAPESAVPTP